MTIRIFALACGVLLLTCCTNQATKPAAASALSDNKSLVDSFLAGFTERKLPVDIGLCPQAQPGEIAHTPAADSIAKKFDLIGHAYYGRIATNGDYSAIITFIAAECYWACITTIGKNGELIDQKSMYLDNGGGADAGYRYNDEVKIDKDLSIVTLDTMVFFDYDSMTGNPLQGGKSQRIVRSKIGKLCTDGKIQLSAMKRDTAVSIIDTATYTYR